MAKPDPKPVGKKKGAKKNPFSKVTNVHCPKCGADFQVKS